MNNVQKYLSGNDRDKSSVEAEYGAIAERCFSSNVTNFEDLFNGTNFNEPISGWDVSAVTSMNHMFFGTSQFNQPLSHWDVSSVTSMNRIFSSSQFNQPINVWNISSITNMESMFESSQFNQTLSAWGAKLGSSASVSQMFANSACPDTSDPAQSRAEKILGAYIIV